MNYKLYISCHFTRKVLPFVVSLFLGVGLFAVGASAAACETGAAQCNCMGEGHQHNTAAKPHSTPFGCASQKYDISCDFETARPTDRIQYVLPNSRIDAPDFSDTVVGITTEVVQTFSSNFAGFPHCRGYANLYIPIYLQNLSLLC
jgi:hypothetical protein